MEYNGYLVHHGIKGQKWGIRRYQNEDGSLTEAGRARYSEVKSAYEKAKSSDDIQKKEKELAARRRDIDQKADLYLKAYEKKLGVKDNRPLDAFRSRKSLQERAIKRHNVRESFRKMHGSEDLGNEERKLNEKVLSRTVKSIGLEDTKYARAYVQDLLSSEGYFDD